MAQKTITVRIPEADLMSGSTVRANFEVRKKLEDEGVPAFYDLSRNRIVVDYGKLEYSFDYVTGEAIYKWTGEIPEPERDLSITQEAISVLQEYAIHQAAYWAKTPEGQIYMSKFNNAVNILAKFVGEKQ
jgi:hypothetical protein